MRPDPNDTLQQIADILSGQTWSSDTLDAIATILREAGWEIRDNFHAPEPDGEAV